MRRLLSLAFAAGCILSAAELRAQIINTGDHGSGTGCGYCLRDGVFTAVRFSLADAMTIRIIESVFQLNNEVVSLGLYGEASGLPFENLLEWDGHSLPVSPVYGGMFTGTGNGCCADWYGLYNLDWNVAAGNYWVVFGSPTGAVIPQVSGVTNPLMHATGASERTFTGFVPVPYHLDWRLNGTADLALRINADPQSVVTPEPSSLLLLATGFVVFAAQRRRRRA